MPARHPPDNPGFLWWLWNWFKYRGGPHEIIARRKTGDYLLRWYLLPPMKAIRVYLHKFVDNDEVEALHDHPRDSVSLILWGQYDEITHEPGRVSNTFYEIRQRFGWLSLIFRKAEFAHRIELVDRKPVWTLFIMGPKKRHWGFLCPRQWKPWRQFHENLDEDRNGCD